jgi:RNA polymerase sigma factor (sigma-70 family)
LRPLLKYARSEIDAYEALGWLPPGQLRAEDVVDAGLVEALQHAHEAPQPERGEFAWLRRFVQRALRREVEQFRRRRGERSLFEPVGIGRRDQDSVGPPRRLVDVLPDPSSPIPEHVVESREFQHALLGLIRELPAAWREPFLLQVRDGLPLREIASLEGLPVREVRQRIALARAFLRARLQEEYGDLPVAVPGEELFELLERVEPTPDQVARTRAHLQAAA